MNSTYLRKVVRTISKLENRECNYEVHERLVVDFEAQNL